MTTDFDTARDRMLERITRLVADDFPRESLRIDLEVLRLAHEREMTEMPHTAWVLTVSMDTGEWWTMVFTTYAAARARLVEYVCESWGYSIEQDGDAPADDDEAIRAYFTQVDDEHFTLDPHEVHGEVD